MLVGSSLMLLWQTGCGPSAPPKGTQLRLRGTKGAICLYNRECASNECRGGHCTEKVDKVGLGGECEGSQFCLEGLYCDLKAKKCAPAIKCEDLQDRLESCIQVVYETLKPSQTARLRRMRSRTRKRFLARVNQILYSRICRATRSGGLPYKGAVRLKAAKAKTDCRAFAIELKAAMSSSG